MKTHSVSRLLACGLAAAPFASLANPVFPRSRPACRGLRRHVLERPESLHHDFRVVARGDVDEVVAHSRQVKA